METQMSNDARNASRNNEDVRHTLFFKQQLDTDFPLSGGEEEDITFFEIEEPTPQEKKRFFWQLNTAFPLSGGETGAF